MSATPCFSRSWLTSGDRANPESSLFSVAAWLIPLVAAIVPHEISHGWVVNAIGDPTAKRLGRLSPDPIWHVGPIGTVALPLILILSGAPRSSRGSWFRR
ncbi:MAG TPA: hypothetical protein VIT45_04660 [Allosphingosinicella sp.]